MSDTPSSPNIPSGNSRFESPLDPIRKFFSDLRELLLHPTDFFRRLPPSEGIGGPLAFGLIAQWIGAILGYLWNHLAGNNVSDLIRQYNRMTNRGSEGIDIEAWWRSNGNEMLQWVLGTGPVIAAPFFTLASILVCAAFVLLGTKIFARKTESGSPIEATYESSVRLVAYGTGPSILNAIPFIGGIAASIYGLVVTAIGLREFYKISTGRAAAIALFPFLLFLGAAFALMVFVAVLVLGLTSMQIFQ